MKPGSGISAGNIIRALRLPFVGASALPFIFGSLLNKDGFNALNFMLGLIGVVSTHLSANLINDYADSKSGRDWKDKKYYGLFGGSKLIQEGVLSEQFYFRLAVFFLSIAGICLFTLAVILRSMLVMEFFLLIVILSWAYSQKPLRLSYRMAGEPVIFLLFGPALVMGGYFIQNEIFPDAKSFILSLPFGFLTTALLFMNEVPDSDADETVGKKTWVALTGKKNAYIIYGILVVFSFFYIAVSMALGYLKWPSVFAYAGALCCVQALMILKKDHGSKDRLLTASGLTIAGLVVMSVVLILDLLLLT